MSLYDTYSQKFQQAMAPAIDYYNRTQAAAAYGLDYNQLSAQQIDQIFGPSSQYNSANTNSSLGNLAYQATGGYNPYIQQVGMAAMSQNMYNPYTQMPFTSPYGQAQYAMYPQMPQTGYTPQYPVYQTPMSPYGLPQAQYGMGQYQYPNVSNSNSLDTNTIYALLSQLQGLQSALGSSSATSSTPNALYNQIYANAIGSLSGGSDYDDQYNQKLEEQILQTQKDGAADDASGSADANDVV